jgi:hypothetical protein
MSVEEIGSMENGREDYSAAYKRWSDPSRYYGFTPPINAHRRDRHTKKCTLYFIESAPFLKIGIADDLKRRLLQFQAGNPHPIRVAAYRSMPAALSRQVERRVHEHFADRAIGREWFRDLDHKEAVPVAQRLINDAEKAVRRWCDDGFFIWADR